MRGWTKFYEEIAFGILILNIIQEATAFKLIVLFAPCEDPVNSFLHVVRRSIRNYTVHEEGDHPPFRGEISHHTRHDLNDACHWVLQETVAIVAVPSNRVSWDRIPNSAEKYRLPFSMMALGKCSDCYSKHLSNETNHVLKEVAVFEYLKDQYLHDVIILHEDDGYEGAVLSSLLGSNSIRVSHLQATGFLKKIQRYFDNWNHADLTDEGRFLISLKVGDHTDNLLKKLLESGMKNMRAKLLVVDCPHKWQERLLEVTSYEVDLVVVSTMPVASVADCPLAIEILPTGSHNHEENDECYPLLDDQRALGQRVLTNIQVNLRQSCCPVKEEEYTMWKSFPAENGTQMLKPVALWANDGGGLLRMEPIDLKRVTLRIAVLQYLPYIALNISEDGEVTLKDCVLKEILRYISGRLNFNYRLMLAPHGDWGTKVWNVWRGAIGMIIKGEADVIPYLTITPNRFEVIEFTKPLSSVQYGLLVPFPKEPPRALIFLRLYAKEVWLMLIGVGILLSFFLSWMQKSDAESARESKILSSFFRCCWLIFGALLQQGGTCLPVTTSGRVVVSTWWLAVMIITTTYSANLIAVLAFPGIRFIVKTLDDMVNHDSIQLTIKEGCPALEDFQQSKMELFRRVREVFLKNPRRIRIMGTSEERCCAIDDVISGKSVYIDDYNYLTWMVDDDFQNTNRCRITIAPYQFSRMDLAVGLRRGSFLLPILNKEIQRMKENGVLEHWTMKYSPRRDECYKMENVLPGQREVSVEDLQGPFYLLLFSFCVGAVVLLLEALYRKISNCRIVSTQRKITCYSMQSQNWEAYTKGKTADNKVTH